MNRCTSSNQSGGLAFQASKSFSCYGLANTALQVTSSRLDFAFRFSDFTAPACNGNSDFRLYKEHGM